jgi:hypothetical protein
MLNISPLFILLPFAAYLVAHTIFGLVNIGHLIKTGATTMISFMVTFAFIFYSLIVVGATLEIVGPLDLNTPITINFSAFSSANPF